MPDRREFLKNCWLTASSMMFARAGMTHLLPDDFDYSDKQRLPLVITTWQNEAATDVAWSILHNDGYALDAVEQGVRVPEANPDEHTVGYGGFPDRDGEVSLDACIMNEQGHGGSVAALKGIKHPISVARRVMERTPHVILVGEGAQRFAVSEGFTVENLLTEKAKKAWEDWKIASKYQPQINWERHDTCGMLAIDKLGRICGACTTSGLAFKMSGRVGDSPIPGAGLYVDGRVGAAASTGLGELVIRTVGSFLVVEAMRRGKSPLLACREAIQCIAQKCPEARHNQVAFIAIDRKGRWGAYALQKGFVFVVQQFGKLQTLEAAALYP